MSQFDPMTPCASSVAPDDEAFWSAVAAQYDVAANFINLENGFFGIPARPVRDALQRYTDKANWLGTYFMRCEYPALQTQVLKGLATFCGVSEEELVITRNATESTNILLQGYPFRAGDEIIHSSQEYESVLEMLKMLHKERGIALNQVELPLDPASDEEIVAIYERAITPKTRLIVLTHMLHRVGQILPVAKIAQMARAHGVDVIVDAAHSFAQLDFRLADLHSDFISMNLHKWLGAPLGTGLLYIRKPRIPDIARLYGEADCDESDIRKLARFGTTPPAPVMAIADAIAFHNAVGGGNKEARLRYLKNYWVSRVKELPRIEMLTPSDAHRSCAIAAFKLRGMAQAEVVERLFKQERIFAVRVSWMEGDGIRVAPHLYNSTAQLDILVGALMRMTGG